MHGNAPVSKGIPSISENTHISCLTWFITSRFTVECIIDVIPSVFLDSTIDRRQEFSHYHAYSLQNSIPNAFTFCLETSIPPTSCLMVGFCTSRNSIFCSFKNSGNVGSNWKLRATGRLLGGCRWSLSIVNQSINQFHWQDTPSACFSVLGVTDYHNTFPGPQKWVTQLQSTLVSFGFDNPLGD